MATIGFIGLGNMGLPMAINLVKAGHTVRGFDLSAEQGKALAAAGGRAAETTQVCVDSVDLVVTMLPAGPHVSKVYSESILGCLSEGTLLIDCSTIDVATARDVAKQAAERGFEMVDAPVSGGTTGAEAGTLTFMVGGADSAFARARPFLEQMGKTIVHAGGSGTGQAAKICNNMMLAINMIGQCEAFAMAEKLGLDTAKLFAISANSSGQSWAMTTYCPVPGLTETAASNRDFKPGFTAAMMLKDLGLSQDAAEQVHAQTPLGAEAQQLFREFVDRGNGEIDFSGIINMIRGEE
ncbi:MAG: 3-hydroxyisobutyrate dehydrogenase [Alphaproteobacteria bacterium]|nr:3-hydroxyisobutyrate dehydrogenase [Alphaproteobacteria bacterium]